MSTTSEPLTSVATEPVVSPPAKSALLPTVVAAASVRGSARRALDHCWRLLSNSTTASEAGFRHRSSVHPGRPPAKMAVVPTVAIAAPTFIVGAVALVHCPVALL